tara:strand:- start:54 stop:614 length:561 start_codon:yes stop_codon:yes gene_type:complete
MKIGIVPGAMKPYHAGHHYLVESALQECDMVTILTTRKSRKGISGDSMYNIWLNYIIPHLQEEYGEKIKVQFVVSPIRTVYEDFIERIEAEGPDGHSYMIYGGTEDNNRFQSKNLVQKYPVAAEHITNVAESRAGKFQRGVGKSPMAKGEWIRNSLETNDEKRFNSMMPAFLKPVANVVMQMLKIS